MELLLNKMTDYERAHPDEWCPISDEMLKQMYPDECQSQEGRDRKAETIPTEEFEMVFDAVLQRYRMRRKKRQGELSEFSVERVEEAEKMIVEQI